MKTRVHKTIQARKILVVKNLIKNRMRAINFRSENYNFLYFNADFSISKNS